MTRKSRRKPRAAGPAAGQGPPEEATHAWRAGNLAPLLVVASLFAVVLFIYAQVRTHSFIDFDDPLYVSSNAQVLRGLTWPGVKWAFTHVHAGYWLPLTWISHMTDVQLFGPVAGDHLLVSAGLHALNSALLFLFLRMATGALWRSAAVAALFATHPMHVESVAWIAERKDTLSTLLFLLCLMAYVRSVTAKSRWLYGASIAALALGLMAKPMLVSTPLVLLLLDDWPLNRWQRANIGRLLAEKIPHAVMVGGSVVATLFAQREAMASTSAIPFAARLGNAAISYVRYLQKTVWPSNLTVIDPFPTRISPVVAALCAIALLAFTVFVVWRRRSFPALFIGWIWFVVTLLPVIGIVQVGMQAMADRFVYIPHIGLFIGVVWTVARTLDRAPNLRPAAAAVSAAIIAACAIAAHAQVRYWEGSIPLFRHALEVTPDNKLAHVNLGGGLLENGDYEGAEREYRLAEGFKPAETVSIGLALALAGEGKLEAAVEAARRAVEANPGSPDAAATLGSVALALGDTAVGERALARSLELRKDPAVAGRLALARGHLEDARVDFAAAVALWPENADLRNSLAAVYARLGADAQAIDEYSTALRLNPRLYDARMNYGALLSRLGRNDDAARQFDASARLRPRSAEPHIYLALLRANQQRFDAAISEIETAIGIDHDASNRLLIEAIRIPPRPTAIDEYLTFLRQQSGGR